MEKAQEEIVYESFTRCLRNRRITHTVVDTVMSAMKGCVAIWLATLAMLGYFILTDAVSVRPEELNEIFQILLRYCITTFMFMNIGGTLVKSAENEEYGKIGRATFIWILAFMIVIATEKEVVMKMVLLCCGIYLIFKYAPAVYSSVCNFKRKNRSEYSIRAHLSGYVLMAQLQGVAVHWIDLEKGTVVLEPLKMDLENLNKSVLISYAGIIAERLNRDKPRLFSLTSEADAEKAKSYVYPYFDEQVSKEYKWFSIKGYRAIKTRSEAFLQECQEKAALMLHVRKGELRDIMKFFEGKRGVTQQEWERFWSDRRSVKENGEI